MPNKEVIGVHGTPARKDYSAAYNIHRVGKQMGDILTCDVLTCVTLTCYL